MQRVYSILYLQQVWDRPSILVPKGHPPTLSEDIPEAVDANGHPDVEETAMGQEEETDHLAFPRPPSIHSQSSLQDVHTRPSAYTNTPSMVTSSTAAQSVGPGEVADLAAHRPPLPPKDYAVLPPSLQDAHLSDRRHTVPPKVNPCVFEEFAAQDDSSGQSSPRTPTSQPSFQGTLRREVTRISIKRKHISNKIKRALSFQKAN